MEVVPQDSCRSSLNGKVRRKSKMKILKKLKPEERGLTRTLWEQVFTEDTKEFLDYYYTEKTKNNQIYVIETDHDIRAMMQLNPYVIQMGKKAIESRYIVAVATEPLYRHRGYMAELLSKTARDLYQQKMPFFFLMPASEKIYYPYNYRFIYAADVWSVKGTDGEELTIQKIVELQNDSGVTLRKAEGKDCKKLGDFAEEVLEKQKIQVYTKRDAAYYMRLLKEQESEKGGILIAEQDGEMRGILVFDEEDGLAVREPLIRKGYEDVFDKAGVILKKEEKKKPLIMARLLNIESLLSSMVCREEMDLEFVLYDPVIRENNRLFMLKGNEEHLVVRTRTAHTGKDDAVQKISVDALTSIVFGYKELEKIEEEEKEIFSAEFKEEISKLMPFSPVFINEIV